MNFTKYLISFLFLLSITVPNSVIPIKAEKPNVILIITDDQGYGDFGFTGNKYVQTPALDKLASESVQFSNFYVSPVCAPTRASLMTGRYSLRTGVRDTYNGGAIMANREVTIAEVLKKESYKTGIFGKWHLGDNYPSRPTDQGFDESLIHLSGGMGQVGDYTTYFQKDSSYYNPVLWRNNNQKKHQGYCSDIFAEGALEFIEKNKDQPFFAYLSFNAPHTPLQVPEEYYNKYKDIDPSAGYDKDGRPFPKMSERDKEDARKVYAMVNNIDDNIAKLLQKLKELKIEDNTIIIFMTDNGPQQWRYNAGLRGLKGRVYRGGVKVPLLIKYPAKYKKAKNVDALTAHIDILPTLAELCGAKLPTDRPIDGQSFLSQITDKNPPAFNRTLFFYWTRRYPELYNNIAFQKGGYKLVGNTSYDAKITDFELFNLNTDPYEQQNLVSKHPELARQLKKRLDETYSELIKSENLRNPPLIHVGSPHENPIVLNRNDASGQRGIWAQEEIYGKWNIKLEKGKYNVKFKFIKPIKAGGRMVMETGAEVYQMKNTTDTDILSMNNIDLAAMNGDLIPFYQHRGKNIMPFWVELERVDGY